MTKYIYVYMCEWNLNMKIYTITWTQIHKHPYKSISIYKNNNNP